MNISELLQRNSSLYPDDIALIEVGLGQSKRTQITWKEFDNEANQIANMLISRGIKKGDRVIHLMRNSINWLVNYFGIIRTGAWVIPLNFRFTAEDIQYCASIGEAKTIIADEEFVERIDKVRNQLTNIKDYFITSNNLLKGWENLDIALKGASQNTVLVELKETDECGLYFTSGTTGTPKPILLTHKNMEFAAITEQAHHHQVTNDNFILIPPLYHTGAKMHWFGSLLVGARATLLTEVSPKIIFETVQREKGTIVFLMVPWANDILAALDSGEIKKENYDLSSWRLWHIGAQPVPPSLMLRWRDYFPDMQYDINYGLSESTGPGCVHLGLENRDKVDSIGKPGNGWQVNVVDIEGRDVAVGDIGELVVKGGGVMREYYKNPDKTAEVLKDGWLFTGDMVRMDKDGFIYIVDRKKDVIICGGENIYPVEIEDILHNHPDIFDVAVIGLPDERLGEIVCAVIQLKAGSKLTEDQVLLYCEQHLPRYKRPRVIIFDDVTRNPTGKLEKPKIRAKFKSLVQNK